MSRRRRANLRSLRAAVPVVDRKERLVLRQARELVCQLLYNQRAVLQIRCSVSTWLRWRHALTSFGCSGLCELRQPLIQTIATTARGDKHGRARKIESEPNLSKLIFCEAAFLRSKSLVSSDDSGYTVNGPCSFVSARVVGEVPFLGEPPLPRLDMSITGTTGHAMRMTRQDYIRGRETRRSCRELTTRISSVSAPS